MTLRDSEKLISGQPLPNGLTLELWNRSRQVAADRWLVALETRIAIPVTADTLPADLQAQAAAVVTALGSEVLFCHREERNFIAAEAMSLILQDMVERVLEMAPGYYGHPEFAARFIRKKWAQCQETQHWQARASAERRDR